MMEKTKRIYICIFLIPMILVGVMGCDRNNVTTTMNASETPTIDEFGTAHQKKIDEEAAHEAISVLKAYIDACNSGDKERIIELSTIDLGTEQTQHIDNGLPCLKYVLESASVYTIYSDDYILVYCKWDSKTLEELLNAGMQHWSFASLIKQDGVWKVKNTGTAP